jgi:hypothetical protein
MELLVPILLGVIILASFFIAYLSAQSWPVYQVVLVVFVLLGGVVFFYLGARTLATHKSWGEKVALLEKQIQEEEQKRLELVGGDQNLTGQFQPGVIPKLQRELEVLVSDRGGALYDVPVESVKDGTAQLTFKGPDHGLVPNSVVFVFDQVAPAEGGRYLGEFKVVTAAENSPAVQIAPNLPLTAAQAKRLATSKGPWTLYSTMPIDDAELFAGMDEATRGALVPKESLAEYANKERKLRDYETFFRENYVQRSLINDAIEKTTSNVQRTEAAVEETKREIAYRTTEKGSLQADLEKFQLESREIATYRKTLEGMLTSVRGKLKATYLENRAKAAELTNWQLKAAEEIDRRSDTAAAR